MKEAKRNDASQTGDIGWIRWERCSGMLLKSGLLLLCLALPLMHGCTRVAVTPEAEETIFNWTQARDYQAQGRYELARQYYLVALAAARTPETQQTLQRELDSVDRMIEAMR